MRERERGREKAGKGKSREGEKQRRNECGSTFELFSNVREREKE